MSAQKSGSSVLLPQKPTGLPVDEVKPVTGWALNGLALVFCSASSSRQC